MILFNLKMQKLVTLFWARKIKKPRDHVSINIRVTLDSHRVCNLAMGIIVPAAAWNAEAQLIRQSCHGADGYNTTIMRRRTLLNTLVMTANETGQVVTPDDVLDLLRPNRKKKAGQIAASKIPTFGRCLDDFGAANKASGLQPNTIRNVASRLAMAITIARDCQLLDRPVNEIVPKDGRAFVGRLRQKGGKAETARRVLGVAREVLRTAMLAGHMDTNPWTDVKVEERDKAKAVESLTEKQVARLRTLELTVKLAYIRDLLLAQIATGMAYIDLKQLGSHNVEEVQGLRVLTYYRKKSKTAAFVPVTDEVEQLLQRWPAGPKLPSNQVYNRDLKEIGKLLGLNFPLTTHHGRKTCGTLLRRAGMPSSTIALVLGHTTTQITERSYIQRGPELLVAVLGKAA